MANKFDKTKIKCTITVLPDPPSEFELNYMVRGLLNFAKRYFAVPENMEEFKAWHLQEYGIPFEPGT